MGRPIAMAARSGRPVGDGWRSCGRGRFTSSTRTGRTSLQRLPRVSTDFYLAWSPDGRKIGFEALDTLDVTWHIYVADADGTNLVRLTLPRRQ